MRFRSEYRLDNPLLSQRSTDNIAVASSTPGLQQNSTYEGGDKSVESFDGNLHGHSMRFRSEYRLDNPFLSQRNIGNIAVASSTPGLQQNSTYEGGDESVESFDGNLHGHSMRFRSEYRVHNPLLHKKRDHRFMSGVRQRSTRAYSMDHNFTTNPACVALSNSRDYQSIRYPLVNNSIQSNPRNLGNQLGHILHKKRDHMFMSGVRQRSTRAYSTYHNFTTNPACVALSNSRDYQSIRYPLVNNSIQSNP